MSGSDSKGKGKGRARDMDEHRDERTPLLSASTSSSGPFLERSLSDSPHATAGDGDGQQPLRRRSLASQILAWLALFMLISLFIFLIFVAFVWATLKGAPAARQAPDNIVSHATRWRTTSFEIVDASEGNIAISVSGELGVDTEWILGLDPEDDSAMTFARRLTGRWLVSTLGGFQALKPTTFTVHNYDGTFLVNCTTSAFDVPVLPNSLTGVIRMAPVKIPLELSPTSNTTDLMRFAESAWLHGAARVKVSVAEMVLQPTRKPWWFPTITKTVRDITTDLEVALPKLPDGYPQPGKPLELSEVLHLGSYSIDVDEGRNSSAITFSALAEVLLPFTSGSYRHVHLPPRIPTFPFLVSLLKSPNSTHGVPFAELFTTPSLNQTASLVSLSLPIIGSVLPIQPKVVKPLSALVSNYLGARATTFLIQSSPSHERDPDFPLTLPPTRVEFPAPSVRPRILRGVTVRDMKLGASPSGEELTASGTLIASFGLPRELNGLTPKLDIRRLWPDTLVYDGIPPPVPPPSNDSSLWAEGSGSPRPPPPLPVPLPERAFARIRPTDWLAARMLTENEYPASEPEDDGSEVRWVTAKIVEVPLEVLPGREAEFQKFVGKILRSRGQGTLAGIRGTSAIAIRIAGLPLPVPPKKGGDEDGQGDIELDGLAFEGSFVIGRKSLTSAPDWLLDA